MKYAVLKLLILLTFYSSPAFSQNRTAKDDFQYFCVMREKMFRNPQVSPLLPSDFEKFSGLSFFAFDEKYRIKANFVKTSGTKFFLMPTSTGGSRKYLKIGDLIFKLEGKEFSLGAYVFEYDTVSQNPREEIKDLFIPFKDLTNGESTYNAGRYVYVRLPKDDKEVILDFNIAYNPNCAYGNPNYACTLPPKENFLQVEINAGEKKFPIAVGNSNKQ